LAPEEEEKRGKK